MKFEARRKFAIKADEEYSEEANFLRNKEVRQIRKGYKYYTPLFWNFCIVTNIGEAIKIEEYVPTIVPMRSTNIKLRVAGEPKAIRAMRTRKSVKEVLRERI